MFKKENEGIDHIEISPKSKRVLGRLLYNLNDRGLWCEGNNHLKLKTALNSIKAKNIDTRFSPNRYNEYIDKREIDGSLSKEQKFNLIFSLIAQHPILKQELLISTLPIIYDEKEEYSEGFIDLSKEWMIMRELLQTKELEEQFVYQLLYGN